MATTGMSEVVVNDSYGGFGISDACSKRIQELLGSQGESFSLDDISRCVNMGGDVFPAPDDFGSQVYARSHPIVIQAIKEIGLKESVSDSRLNELKIVKVPTFALSTSYISEYDGIEDVDWNVTGALIDIIKAHDPATITLEDAQIMLTQMQAIATYDILHKCVG